MEADLVSEIVKKTSYSESSFDGQILVGFTKNLPRGLKKIIRKEIQSIYLFLHLHYSVFKSKYEPSLEDFERSIYDELRAARHILVNGHVDYVIVRLGDEITKEDYLAEYEKEIEMPIIPQIQVYASNKKI